MEISKKKLIKRISYVVLAVLIFSIFVFFQFRKYEFKTISSAETLSKQDFSLLQQNLFEHYQNEYAVLHTLPYQINTPELNILAESAMLIDASNGCILYSKNQNQIIPPASLTKLFAMYVVEEEIAVGNIKYDDLIPLLPECWACNMPPHSSLMFLGEGQTVTLEELLLGLSICSGNDAAYAIAFALFGSIEEFVLRMNEVAERYNLVNTHFEEVSGYSELNTTTAYEMAAFCKIYISHFPQSIQKFHSVKEFTYPKAKNLAKGDVISNQDFSDGIPSHITMPITQKNTNPLLPLLDGCDGLKTGYIDESGYNLALTASRNGTRYVSVTLKGPGNSLYEGQQARIADGTTLMEWAFSSFCDTEISKNIQRPYLIKVYNSNIKAVNLVPAFSVNTITVPFITGKDVSETASKIKCIVDLPEFLSGQIIQGSEYGQIKIMVDNIVLQTIPLVSDRSTKRANFVIRLMDTIILKTK